MKKIMQCTLCALLTVAPLLAHPDSIRCGRKLVKTNESANALIKKCGKPVRKFSSKTSVSIQGSQMRVSVSNWVYERRGKRDMIVSIHDGTVIKLEVE